MLMKKILLSLAAVALSAVAATSVQAQEKKLVDMTGWQLYANDYDAETQSYIPRKLDEPTLSDYSRYYYNAKNEQAVEVNSYSQMRYTYNADGTTATMQRWAHQSGNFCMQSETKYEYDAQKNMTKQTQYNYNTAGEQTSVSGSMFEDYVNGMYQVMKNFNATGDVTSETHYEYTFDDQKQVLSMVQLTGAAFDQKKQGTFYTYENGKLVKEVMAYYNAAGGEGHEWDNVQNTTNYTYNADGTIATRSIVSDTSYGHSEIEWRYTYSTLDPSLIPQGLTCDGTIGGNEVYVKWNAVAGAEKYLVMYDNQTAEVEGKTDFITPMLNDGEHQVAVLAYVGGEQKNITDFAKVSVKDEGNLPLQNFQVTAAEKVDVESYGYVNQYYNLTLSWTVPEGASKITDYKVYVDKGESWNPSTTYTMAMPEAEKQDSYNDVNTWVTNRQNFYWTTFENTYYDEDTWQTVSLGNGPDVKMWITAIYASGESQKSNVIELNVYNLANGGSGETDVKAVKAATADAPVEIFNVAGQQIKKANGRQLILIRHGNEVKKVLK